MRTAQLNISYQEDFKQNQLGDRRAQVLVKTRACTILILSLVLFRLVLGIQQQFYKKMWTSAWFKLGWSDIRKRVRCQLDHHHHHVAKAYINLNPMKSHTRNRTYKRVFSQPNFWSKLFSIRVIALVALWPVYLLYLQKNYCHFKLIHCISPE